MSFETGVTALAQAIGADIKNLVPKIQAPIYYDTLAGNAYTVTAADTGKQFLWNGTADLTMTFPDSLPDGFQLKVSQFTTGRVILNGATRTYFANGTAAGLFLPGQSAYVSTATVVAGGNSVRILNVSLDQPLPTQYLVSSSAQTRNVTTMSSIPGVAVALDAGSVYEIDLQVTFTSAITTNTLKLGFAALPTGATVQFHGVVFNTNVSGTAAATHKPLFSSADVVTGIAGSSAVTSGSMLATIKGRITTVAGGGGTLQATAGSIATTGNVSIAAGAATMKVQKVL